MGIFWQLRPARTQWSKLPANPVPVHHGASATIGRKIYVLGGFRLPDTGKVGWYPVNNAWVFDHDQNWSALPTCRRRAARSRRSRSARKSTLWAAPVFRGAHMPDGLYGGGPIELLGTNEVLDTETNTWSTAAAMPTPRNHHALAVIDGKIYAIGGRIGSCFSAGWSSNISMNDAYDIATQHWRRARRCRPRARHRHRRCRRQDPCARRRGLDRRFRRRVPRPRGLRSQDEYLGADPRMPTPRHGFAAATTSERSTPCHGVNNAGGAGTLSVVAVNVINPSGRCRRRRRTRCTARPRTPSAHRS